ncbi:MAG: diguanylate cyclase [Sulfurimonas sp.]|uniref:diguanylate cyclase n=1 Tax=Sulfurimonas sp. TaxID=2022749 RepID=UPI00261977BE|nr:diguanylate cyclase [Sulfurimonas sp.]MDD5400970.1 diguanylate cyclase [Sulfurimonas sp.]
MKKILIIEASSVFINMLKNMFIKNIGMKVFSAKSLEEASYLIDTHNFFLVISNLVLPDALNLEILKLLAKHKLPTIVFSSRVESNLLNNPEYPNIIDYVIKDFNYGINYLSHLVEAIEYCRGKEVLVVDDSTAVSKNIQQILEKILLKVHVAKDGVNAIELLAKNSYISLIISDYNMPNMNGLELIKTLKSDIKYSKLPILIITGENDNDLKIKLYKYGANDVILKPVLEEELSSKIIHIFLNMKQMEEISEFNKIVDDNVITSSTDTSGKIILVSNAFCEISGYTREELIGKNHNILRHPDMPDLLYVDLWKTITSGKVWRGELKNRKKDGSYYWVDAIIEPKFSKDNHIIGFNALRHNITDKKKIYELSITDGLTSLYNRRHFNDIADSVLENSLRNNKIFAFVLLDVDNFKKYNDNYGHQDGDSVLINLANVLKESFKRSEDTVFRLGGEEFGVLISAKSIDDIYTLVESARKNIESLSIEHKLNPPLNTVTASFGVAIISSSTKDKFILDTVYKQADDALYESKERGRNRITYKQLGN